MKTLTKILLCMPLACAPVHLYATSTTTTQVAQGTLPVTATVKSNCVISTGAGTAMPFGNYTGTALQVQGGITYTCTLGTAARLAIGPGNASGATTSSRAMSTTAGGANLNYSLYSNTGRSTNWGNSSGVDDVAVIGTGSAATANVFGTVAANQVVSVGNFTDNPVLTLTYQQ